MKLRKLFVIAIAAAVCFGMLGCGSKPRVVKTEVVNGSGAQKMESAAPEAGKGGSQMSTVTQITPAQLDTMKGQADVFLLDVREPAELTDQLGKIDGVVNIPLGQLEKRIGELDKTKKIVTICKSGGRSMVAAQLLVRNGFPQVFNLNGGMLAYRKK